MMSILSRLLGIDTVGERYAGSATEKTSSTHGKESRTRRREQQKFPAELANAVAEHSTMVSVSRSLFGQDDSLLAVELDISAFCSELDEMRAGMTGASWVVSSNSVHVGSSEAHAHTPPITTSNVLSVLEGELEAAICFLRDGAARA